MKMPKSIKELPKEIRDEMYKDKVKKNFFKDESQRNLWIRLNAEHIHYVAKKLNKVDFNQNLEIGKLGEPFSCMQISANQLDYDEHMCNAPRFSFEELVLSQDELFKLANKRHREEINKMFNLIGDVDGIIQLGDIDDEDL
jgi:hypothetical protein